MNGSVPWDVDLSASQLPRARAEEEEEEEESSRAPRVGDRVMVMKDPWLQMILSGDKTMEIRSCKCRPGFVWLAAKGMVHGNIIITESVELTPEEFEARVSEHRWPANRSFTDLAVPQRPPPPGHPYSRHPSRQSPLAIPPRISRLSGPLPHGSNSQFSTQSAQGQKTGIMRHCLGPGIKTPGQTNGIPKCCHEPATISVELQRAATN